MSLRIEELQAQLDAVMEKMSANESVINSIKELSKGVVDTVADLHDTIRELRETVLICVHDKEETKPEEEQAMEKQFLLLEQKLGRLGDMVSGNQVVLATIKGTLAEFENDDVTRPVVPAPNVNAGENNEALNENDDEDESDEIDPATDEDEELLGEDDPTQEELDSLNEQPSSADKK